MFEQTGLLLRGVCEFCFYDLLERLLRVWYYLAQGIVRSFCKQSRADSSYSFSVKGTFGRVGAITELLYTRFMLLLSGWDDKFFK